MYCGASNNNNKVASRPIDFRRQWVYYTELYRSSTHVRSQSIKPSIKSCKDQRERESRGSFVGVSGDLPVIAPSLQGGGGPRRWGWGQPLIAHKMPGHTQKREKRRREPDSRRVTSTVLFFIAHYSLLYWYGT